MQASPIYPWVLAGAMIYQTPAEFFLVDGTAKLPTQATRRNAMGVLAPEASKPLLRAYPQVAPKPKAYACAVQIVNAQRTSYANNRNNFVYI